MLEMWWSRDLDALEVVEKALSVVGLWPTQPNADGRRWRVALHNALPAAVLARYGYSLVFQAVNVWLAWGRLDSVAEFASALLFYAHLFNKFASLRADRYRLRDVFAGVRLRNATLGCATPANLATLRGVEARSRRWLRVVPALAAALIGAAIFMLVPLGLRERRLPRKLYLPYDARATPVFEATLIVTTLLTFVDLLTVVLCDAALVGPALHVAAHFRMLRIGLEDLKSTSDADADETTPQRHDGVGVGVGRREGRRIDTCLGAAACGEGVDPAEDGRRRRGEALNAWLGEWVGHHQAVLEEVKQLQAVFKVALADQIVLNLLLGSVAMYVTTLSDTTDAASMVVLAFLLGGVFEFGVFCWCSEVISDESEGIHRAAYSCDWLLASAQVKSSLRLVMAQAQRSAGLRAAGVPLTRRTFRAVCKAAYYLHAILRKIYAGEKLNRRPGEL